MPQADRLLRFSPFQPIATLASRHRPAVLAFHGVDDPDNFERIVDHVVRHYRPISVDDLHAGLLGKVKLKSRSVLITFDDGHRSVLDHALPILSARGIPGVAFVVAGLLSSSEDFWWSTVEGLVSAGAEISGHEGLTAAQAVSLLKTLDNDSRMAAIAELSAGRDPKPRAQLRDEDLSILMSGGISIGNHTWTHPCLNRCTPNTIREEIERADERLRRVTGEPSRWFAYPNGDWDPHAEVVLADLGYRMGFLFDHHHVRRDQDPLRVSRLRVNSDTSVDRLALVMSGLHPFLHSARGRN